MTREDPTQRLDGRHEHAALEVGGAALEVVALRGDEGVCRLFRYQVLCSAGAAGLSPEALVACDARITLYAYGAERVVHGVVTEAAASFSDEGEALVELAIRPAVYGLTLGRSCRNYQDMSVVEIAKAVLASSPQPTRWEVIEPHPPHVYCAQYREDDWTFVCRLLEEEGIYHWFDHEGGQTSLVFGDHSTSAPDLPGGALLTFAFATGMVADREIVEELGSVTRSGPTRFSVGSFNAANPASAVKAATGSGPYEIYDAPGGGPESSAACARQAAIMRQAAVVAAHGVAGLTTSARVVPGMVVQIDGHRLARLDGRYFVTEVTCEVTQRRRGEAGAGGEARPFECRFRAIPAATPYRRPEATAVSQQAGLQTGVVVGPPGDEVYPDGAGRVRVQLHWDRDGKRDAAAGKWMRVAQRGTAGSMLLPRTGWNVVTFNDEGTVDAPSVLSRIHDAEHPPSYGLPANKTRVVWKTATTPGGGSFNEIYFEDKKGEEEVFVHASKDMKLLTQHVKTEDIGRDTTREVGRDHALTVNTSHTEAVKRDQRVSVGAVEEHHTAGGAAKSVGGDETIAVAGNRRVKTGTSHTTVVDGTRRLSVGAALLDVTLGNMSAGAEDKVVLVGGARIAVAAGGMTESVATVSTQVVGGIKLEIAKENRLFDVKETLSETVGGAVVMKAGRAFFDTADVLSRWEVAAKMSAAAPTITLQAQARIQLVCGSSAVVITPESIEITSPKFEMSGASLDIKASVVKHN